MDWLMIMLFMGVSIMISAGLSVLILRSEMELSETITIRHLDRLEGKVDEMQKRLTDLECRM